MSHMAVEVEVGILDPAGVIQRGRHREHAASERLDEMDAFLHHVGHPVDRPPVDARRVEHQHPDHVHHHRRGLRLKKQGVGTGDSFHQFSSATPTAHR